MPLGGRRLGRPLPRAQHADHGADFLQSALGGATHLGDGLLGGGGIAIDQALGGRGLDTHSRQRMGRDVVHLPGDGDALGLHPTARLGVAAALGGNRPLLDGAGALLVLVQSVASERGRQGQRHVLEHGELRQDARLLRGRRCEQQHQAHDRARDGRLGRERADASVNSAMRGPATDRAMPFSSA